MWLNMVLVDSSDYNNTRTIFSHLFHQETIEFILSLAPLVQVSGIGTCVTIKQKRKPPSPIPKTPNCLGTVHPILYLKFHLSPLFIFLQWHQIMGQKPNY